MEIERRLDGWQRAEDPRMWKIILSPERGEALDLVDHTRRVMNAMERDLGTRLEWVAIDHHNTERLLAFFDDARAGGDLWGGDPALDRTRRALLQAGSLLQRARFRAACHPLELVDRLLAPSQAWRNERLFVGGPAAADLADEVGTLYEALDCDDRL